MCYLTVRIVIIILLISVFLLLIKKNIIKPKKKTLLALLLIALTIYIVIWRIPIENIFFRFSSAETAYRYSYTYKIYNITSITQNVSIVTFAENSAISSSEIIRDKRGWKVRCPDNASENRLHAWKNILIDIMKLPNCNKYYISFMADDEDYPNSILISDNRKSEFNTFKITKSDSLSTVYYTVTNGNLDNYYITINGTRIGMNDLF